MADAGKGGVVRRFFGWLFSPSARWSVFALVVVGLVVGVVGVIGTQVAVAMTGSDEFCGNACHSHAKFVFPEHKQSAHYINRTGVRAVCSDCHVPKAWTYKMMRKIQASREVWGKITGTIDTREKFEAKRLTLARREWARMKSVDSRECRNCHSFESMNPEAQKQRARKQYEMAKEDNMTCNDRHKGIAHYKPEGMTDADEE